MRNKNIYVLKKSYDFQWVNSNEAFTINKISSYITKLEQTGRVEFYKETGAGDQKIDWVKFKKLVQEGDYFCYLKYFEGESCWRQKFDKLTLNDQYYC